MNQGETRVSALLRRAARTPRGLVPWLTSGTDCPKKLSTTNKENDMKKQQSKKLVLHRETVRRLDSKELSHINGGFVTCGILESGCTSCINTLDCSG